MQTYVIMSCRVKKKLGPYFTPCPYARPVWDRERCCFNGSQAGAFPRTVRGDTKLFFSSRAR